MTVPFLDLKAQYNTIREEIYAAIANVLDTNHYILGPHVKDFEESFSKAHAVDFGVAVNNGTSALHVALWALGIKAGDEVILPVNTFIATAEAVVLCGATPVFVDHDEYYNIDPDQVESKITRRTKAILPVHLYGQPARMDVLKKTAERYKLALIEDAAQAHLAKFAGSFIGNFGAATCFSFYPGKNLGACGEGGAVITNDGTLAQKMRLLRDHGSETKYYHVVAGHNYRLEALQGAILNVKLKQLQRWTDMRRANAAIYDRLLANTSVIPPKVHSSAEPVYHLYVIQCDRRDEMQAHLKSKGIDTGLHYPVPLHVQPCFAHLGYKGGAFPRAEVSAKRILSLPMYPELTGSQIEYVVNSIKEFFGDK